MKKEFLFGIILLIAAMFVISGCDSSGEAVRDREDNLEKNADDTAPVNPGDTPTIGAESGSGSSNQFISITAEKLSEVVCDGNNEGKLVYSTYEEMVGTNMRKLAVCMQIDTDEFSWVTLAESSWSGNNQQQPQHTI